MRVPPPKPHHAFPSRLYPELGWSQPCDVWSIGCIIFEYYVGFTLFQVSGGCPAFCSRLSVLPARPPGSDPSATPPRLSSPDPRQQRAPGHDGTDPGPHPFPDGAEDKVSLERGAHPSPSLSTKLVYITSFSFFFDTFPPPSYSQMGE